jgi:hypothetical protein
VQHEPSFRDRAKVGERRGKLGGPQELDGAETAEDRLRRALTKDLSRIGAVERCIRPAALESYETLLGCPAVERRLIALGLDPVGATVAQRAAVAHEVLIDAIDRQSTTDQLVGEALLAVTPRFEDQKVKDRKETLLSLGFKRDTYKDRRPFVLGRIVSYLISAETPDRVSVSADRVRDRAIDAIDVLLGDAVRWWFSGHIRDYLFRWIFPTRNWQRRRANNNALPLFLVSSLTELIESASNAISDQSPGSAKRYLSEVRDDFEGLHDAVTAFKEASIALCPEAGDVWGCYEASGFPLSARRRSIKAVSPAWFVYPPLPDEPDLLAECAESARVIAGAIERYSSVGLVRACYEAIKEISEALSDHIGIYTAEVLDVSDFESVPLRLDEHIWLLWEAKYRVIVNSMITRENDKWQQSEILEPGLD